MKRQRGLAEGLESIKPKVESEFSSSDSKACLPSVFLLQTSNVSNTAVSVAGIFVNIYFSSL
jgi:hypothetical protein